MVVELSSRLARELCLPEAMILVRACFFIGYTTVMVKYTVERVMAGTYDGSKEIDTALLMGMNDQDVVIIKE